MAAVFTTPDLDAVVSEVDIAAPPERVFAALTDAEQCKRWAKGGSCQLTLWEIDPRPGGKWRFVSRDPASNNYFIHHGAILEMNPPRLLVYSWFANWHLHPEQQTVVRWELTPTATGTKLKVTHSGLAHDAKAREGYRGGWPGLLQHIKLYFAH